jgi:hypothetical protein
MNSKAFSFSTMLICAVASAALFYVLEYHWQHALGLLPYLPYLLFLSCPLMHLFMHHGGHGHHSHDGGQGGNQITDQVAGQKPGTPQ